MDDRITTENKKALKVFLIVGLLVALYFLWKRKQPAQNIQLSGPQPSDVTNYFSGGEYIPPSKEFYNVGDGKITVDFSKLGYPNLSDAYIPLFGFVGIAQGVMFQ